MGFFGFFRQRLRARVGLLAANLISSSHDSSLEVQVAKFKHGNFADGALVSRTSENP